MDKMKMLQIFLDINNATEVAGAILETINNEGMVENDNVIWLIYGALEQIKKIRKLAQEIDTVMSGEECA